MNYEILLCNRVLHFTVHVQVEHHCLQRQIAEPAILKGSESISVGREVLRRTRPQTVSLRRLVVSKFSFTRPALVLLERISVAIGSHESVLLVGETGTGKTSSVQYLSELMCKLSLQVA